MYRYHWKNNAPAFQKRFEHNYNLYVREQWSLSLMIFMLEKSCKNNCGCYTLKEKMHLKVIQYVVTPSRVTILFLKSKFIFGVKILHQIIIDSISFAPPTVCQYLSSNSDFKRKKPSFYFQNLSPKCLYLYWPPAGLMRYINIYKKKFHDVICGGLKIATQVLFINFYDPLLWFLILKQVDQK